MTAINLSAYPPSTVLEVQSNNTRMSNENRRTKVRQRTARFHLKRNAQSDLAFYASSNYICLYPTKGFGASRELYFGLHLVTKRSLYSIWSRIHSSTRATPSTIKGNHYNLFIEHRFEDSKVAVSRNLFCYRGTFFIIA